MQSNSFVTGWGNSELDFVTSTSLNSMFVHASDWAINLSTLTNFNVETFEQRTHATANTVTGTHTVTFLMTDGDNLQWLLSDFATSDKWFGSPNRGQVNIGKITKIKINLIIFFFFVFFFICYLYFFYIFFLFLF